LLLVGVPSFTFSHSRALRARPKTGACKRTPYSFQKLAPRPPKVVNFRHLGHCSRLDICRVSCERTCAVHTDAPCRYLTRHHLSVSARADRLQVQTAFHVAPGVSSHCGLVAGWCTKFGVCRRTKPTFLTVANPGGTATPARSRCRSRQSDKPRRLFSRVWCGYQG